MMCRPTRAARSAPVDGSVVGCRTGLHTNFQAAVYPLVTTIYYDTNGTADDVTIADCHAF